MNNPHPVVTHEDWLKARRDLLAKEKEFTRLRDELSRQRRELPWEKVEKDYVFDGPNGPESLADLFAGKRQLVVYHFMFGPDWEQGCSHCSFWADNFDGIVVHLKQRDTTLLAISRAPLAKLQAFRQRMGWRFRWLSSANTDFNIDYHVSLRPEERAAGTFFYNYTDTPVFADEAHGISVFYRDDSGAIFHTYSTYARGLDMLNGAYHYLDLLPLGRNEAEGGSGWIKHHDRYPD